MKKNDDSVRDWAGKIFRRFLSRTSLMVTLGVLGLYLICCLFYWYAEFGGPKGTAFYNVLLWNTATLFGQDYADHYPESVGGRLLGIVVLLISMFGVSAVTGYISSYLIERRANSVRGLKKLQSLRNHIIICGWKNNQKGLILDIKRKNKELKLSDMVLINNRDEEQIRFFLADEELRGIQYVHGDFSEEDVLKRANAKYASKALILGEEDDDLTPELIDSRVFAAMLMLKGMNPKIHICAQVQTKKYKNYLESNKCDEVIYSEEYTRYILSTATLYNGMAKVLSSLFDNGDGISVQIFDLDESWHGKTFAEVSRYYKEHGHIMVLGVLENMGAEYELKHSVLAEAQKSTDYTQIVQRLKDVKSMERNAPFLNPPDDYILKEYTGLVVLGDEI